MHNFQTNQRVRTEFGIGTVTDIGARSLRVTLSGPRGDYFDVQYGTMGFRRLQDDNPTRRVGCSELVSIINGVALDQKVLVNGRQVKSVLGRGSAVAQDYLNGSVEVSVFGRKPGTTGSEWTKVGEQVRVQVEDYNPTTYTNTGH